MEPPEGSELEISISKESFSTKLKSNAVDRLANGIADLLSPFTESAGLLGDSVRMYRQNNAIKGLAKATQLARHNEVELKPVEPKFLVQWLEGASLEDDGKEDLSDLWAGLLVAESALSRPSHYFFRRALLELSGRHIDCLLHLCGESRGSIRNIKGEKINPKINIDKFFGENYYATIDDIGYDKIYNDIYNLNSPGLIVYTFEISQTINRGGPDVRNVIYEKTDKSVREFVRDFTVDLLQNMGFVKIEGKHIAIKAPDTTDYSISNSEQTRVSGSISYCYLTRLGLEFILSCNGRS